MIINIYHAFPTCFSRSNQGKFESFPPTVFAVFDCMYVIFLLVSYSTMKLLLFVYTKSLVYKYHGPFFTCNFLEDAWLTRYDIIVLTLFFVHSLCILNSLLKSWSCLLFLFIDHFLPFCFIHAWFSLKGTSYFTHNTDMKYSNKVFWIRYFIYLWIYLRVIRRFLSSS